MMKIPEMTMDQMYVIQMAEIENMRIADGALRESFGLFFSPEELFIGEIDDDNEELDMMFSLAELNRMARSEYPKHDISSLYITILHENGEVSVAFITKEHLDDAKAELLN